RAQKSEELGRLAGGIAHDFNNMLTVILGYSEMALLNIESSSPLYNEIKEIRDAAYRSANLTRQLLLFSRRQSMENTLLNINTIIEDLMHMLDRLLGENVIIKKVLKKGLWDVCGDLGCMEQVIMNLIINAKESIPDKGKIVIRTDNVVVNESILDDQKEARPGKFIVIEVKDSGMGMDNKTLQKIFTPFFTTKEPEKGTGLGLSVVNNIIKNSQGWIKVNSQLGKGTEFKIYLPACFKEVIEEEEEEKDMKVLRGQGERILLVEDEESVRDFAQLVLEKNGYKVTEATTGKQAQLEFRKRDDFKLLFTDMVLPDETGLELAQQIREKNPDIPVLLCSGYVDDRLRRLKDKKEKWEFIQKPYNIVNILQAVKRVLGEE
ncbi:MAG: response regulator, partial [bacterium]